MNYSRTYALVLVSAVVSLSAAFGHPISEDDQNKLVEAVLVIAAILAPLVGILVERKKKGGVTKFGFKK